jgi:hypothetical protein
MMDEPTIIPILSFLWALLATDSCLLPGFPICMYVCMWWMHVCGACMYACGACMYVAHVCMHVVDACMWCMYACGGCMYVVHVCMWRMYVCGACMWCTYACSACMYMVHACVGCMYACGAWMSVMYVCTWCMHACSVCMHACSACMYVLHVCMWCMYVCGACVCTGQRGESCLFEPHTVSFAMLLVLTHTHACMHAGMQTEEFLQTRRALSVWVRFVSETGVLRSSQTGFYHFCTCITSIGIGPFHPIPFLYSFCRRKEGDPDRLTRTEPRLTTMTRNPMEFSSSQYHRLCKPHGILVVPVLRATTVTPIC